MFRVEVESVGSALVESAAKLTELGRWTDPIDEPTSIGSRFGATPRSTFEVLGATIEIANPADRLAAVPSRPISAGFALANSLWTIRASRNEADILPYNPLGQELTDGSGEFEGAMGSRIAAAYGDPQALKSIVELLRRSPTSRRAISPIIRPEDLEASPNDFPCVVACQYFIRRHRLDAVTYMRSQSLTGLLAYDTFLFTFLQEVVAAELGLEMGTYTHMMGSLHVYEEEMPTLEAIAGDTPSSIRFPQALSRTPLSDETILAAEELLRHRVSAGETDAIAPTLPVDADWRPLLALLELRLRQVRGDAEPEGLRMVLEEGGYAAINV